MEVGGAVGDMHSTAQAWGGHSQTAGAQADAILNAASAMPPSVCIGPAANRMRAFASELHAGMSAVAAAYDKVASMLKRVAHAVDEAKQNEKDRDRAKEDLTAAQHKLAGAEIKLASAEAALAATKAVASTTSGVGSIFGAPVQSEIAKVVAQEQAGLEQIRREVTAAQHAVDHARRVYQAAERRFEQADERRKAMLRSFALLCQEEALIATRAIPQVPFVNFVDVAAVDELRSEAASLLGLPLLVASRFAIVHLRQVELALRHHDSARLDGWASSAYRQLFPPPPKPKPQHHSSSVLGSILGDLKHYVLSPSTHLIKGVGEGLLGIPVSLFQLGKLGAENLAALDSIPNLPVDIATGVNPLRQTEKVLAEDAALIKAPFENPVGFGKALVGWDVFKRNGFEGAGNLLPSVALTAGTDGTGKLAETAATGAQDAVERAQPVVVQLGVPGARITAVVVRADAVPLLERSNQLLAQSAQLYQREASLKAFEHVTDTAAGVGVLQSTNDGTSEDPFVPSLVAGKAYSAIR